MGIKEVYSDYVTNVWMKIPWHKVPQKEKNLDPLPNICLYKIGEINQGRL